MKPFEEMTDIEILLELTRWEIDARMVAARQWTKANRPDLRNRAFRTMWDLTDLQTLADSA